MAAQGRPTGGALKAWWKRGAQLALTVAVTWVIVERVGLDLAELRGVDASLWIPDPALLAAASALLLASYFASAALWGLMVHDLGGPRLPAREAVPLFMIANLARYVPGKLWQIAGLTLLAKARGVPAAAASGAAVLGQGIALVAAAGVGLGALLAGPPAYRRWGLVAAGALVVLAVLLAVPRVFRGLARAWFRLARTPAAELRARHGLGWLVLYVLNWAAYALAFWVLARSLGLAGALVPVGSAFAAAYALGYLAVFAPAGIGPREGFLIVFLTPHFGAAPSGVLAIVARIWTSLVELVPAGIFWARHLTSRTGGPPAGSAEGRP